MATVEQVLLRKAGELQAQLAAIHTTLALLQRQPSRNGGAMVADVQVAHGKASNGKKKAWRKPRVAQETVESVIQLLQKARRPLPIQDVRSALAAADKPRGTKAVGMALQLAVDSGRVTRIRRGWYEATE